MAIKKPVRKSNVAAELAAAKKVIEKLKADVSD
jgi:hypothetical protein